MTATTRRRLEILVPSGFSLLAIALAVLASSAWSSTGWFAKPCGLREMTGLPCLACGGTRSVQALAAGDLLGALRFNPLVFFAVCAAVAWFAWSLRRAWRPEPSSPPDAQRQVARAKWWLAGLGVAALGNWFYLVYFLPP